MNVSLDMNVPFECTISTMQSCFRDDMVGTESFKEQLETAKWDLQGAVTDSYW